MHADGLQKKDTDRYKKKGNEITEVRMFRVSDVVDEPVGLLKIDAEGHEPESLEGSIGLICRHHVASIYVEFSIYFIKRSSTRPPEYLLETLIDLGYKCNAGLVEKSDIPKLIKRSDNTDPFHQKSRINLLCHAKRA